MDYSNLEIIQNKLLDPDESLTDEELVAAGIALAGMFYESHGYTHQENFKYYASKHPQELNMWEMACDAFMFIRGSDLTDALASLGEDE